MHEIPVSCLVQPKPQRLLREPDELFIASLKMEMVSNPLPLVTPIPALVRLKKGEVFDKNNVNSYVYEAIGGNNSRIALQELTKEYPEQPHFKTRMVGVYSNLSDHLALRLAAKHNKATEFTHTLTTQDKVCTTITGSSEKGVD